MVMLYLSFNSEHPTQNPGPKVHGKKKAPDGQELKN